MAVVELPEIEWIVTTGAILEVEELLRDIPIITRTATTPVVIGSYTFVAFEAISAGLAALSGAMLALVLIQVARQVKTKAERKRLSNSLCVEAALGILEIADRELIEGYYKYRALETRGYEYRKRRKFKSRP